MIRNYFKVALRHLLKNKVFSAINIFGLSTGIACCVVLSLYIKDEFSYEKHFDGHERIYRIYTTFVKEGNAENFPRTSPPIAMDVAEVFPEIETATRVVSPPEVDQNLIRYGDETYYEKNCVLVDSTFFDVFQYAFKEGDRNTALDGPSAVVLSQKLSAKIFGDKSPLDELIIINSGRSVDTFRITGVLRETPNKSHVDADLYMGMNSQGWGRWVLKERTWAWNNFVGSYIKLKPNQSPDKVDSKFPALLEKNAGEQLRLSGMKKELHLQPLDDVRLYSDFSDTFGDTDSGRITYVYILSSIGAFILLIACINFMNLTTAKSSQRAGEVGVRKSMGAQRSHLISQFLGESMTIVFASILLSIFLILLVLPIINQVTMKELSINASNILFLVAAMIVIGLTTGLLAGSYPAFFLSAFQPAKVLKSKNLSSDGSQWLRKGLVVFQFIITITLISAIIITQQQLSFIQNKPLGFNEKQTIMVPFRSEDATSQFLTLRSAFKQIAGVEEVSATTSLPSTPLFRDFSLFPKGSTPDKAANHRVVNIDENYFKVLDIKLLAGRDFIPETDTFSYRKTYNQIIVNRESLKVSGISLEDAIGSTLSSEFEGNVRTYEIIGVVEDFHQFSLHQPITPMLFQIPSGRQDYVFLTASISGETFKPTLEQMKTAWDKIVPSMPFEYSLLSDNIKKQYESDSRISMMLTGSTLLAIIISCLGLYGLSVYMAERKIKEIGIRKVLGASVPKIVGMLSKDFIQLVMIAFVIAVPLGYYAMAKWLELFAYKIELGYTVFLMAGGVAFLIAWLTVGFESFKAANANPVKSLRSE